MLDKIDMRLIQELQQDGRQSHVELAQKLNIGESTVRRRLQRLLKNGSIRAVAVPNPVRLGLNFVCTMRFQVKKDKLRQFGRELAQYPNVYYLAIITGEWDIIAILILRSPEQLSDFMWRVVPRPEVVKSETVIDIEVLKTPWEVNIDLASLLES
jgi:Lrp/AsnC family transcriptional regulator for asnA, asnC and gidA